MIPISDASVRHAAFPLINATLIGLNTLVFLYELQVGGLGLLAGSDDPDVAALFFKWGVIPDELTSGESFRRLDIGPTEIDIETPIPTWGTIFSSMFMHGSLLHFLGNMLFLWVFGDNIEDRFGHFKYLLFYLFTGVVATLSHVAIDPNSQTPLVGASGAISGVMGAYLIFFPFNQIRVLIIFFLITVVSLPAVLMLGYWFLLQLVNVFGSMAAPGQSNVAFVAHIGGFVAGAGITIIYRLLIKQPALPPRQRPPWDYWRR